MEFFDFGYLQPHDQEMAPFAQTNDISSQNFNLCYPVTMFPEFEPFPNPHDPDSAANHEIFLPPGDLFVHQSENQDSGDYVVKPNDFFYERSASSMDYDGHSDHELSDSFSPQTPKKRKEKKQTRSSLRKPVAKAASEQPRLNRDAPQVTVRPKTKTSRNMDNLTEPHLQLLLSHVKWTGDLTLKERKAKVAKYLYRKYRRWLKVVKYEVRQRVATQRLRVKGRFISHEESEKLMKDSTPADAAKQRGRRSARAARRSKTITRS